MNLVTLTEKHIEIIFDFDWAVVNRVRVLPDCEFVRQRKMWRTPATAFHAQAVIKQLRKDFTISDDVQALARTYDPEAPREKLKKGSYPHLFPFQRDGLEFIIGQGGRAILADDMGLGKTVTALAYMDYQGGRTLVVAPSNVTYKWKAECERWLPGRSVEIVTKGKQQFPASDVVILSYDLLKAYVETIVSFAKFDVLIADECHYVKNFKSQRTKSVKRVASVTDCQLYLSGTPFTNRPSELFPILNMLHPEIYRNFFSFAKRYCGAELMNGYWYYPNILTNGDELRERLSRVMIRHTKQESLKDLPDKTRVLIPITISNIKEYTHARTDFKRWYAKEGKDATKATQLVKLGVLRHVMGRGKVGAAVELAEELLHDDEQVVLFAHHKDVVADLLAALEFYKTGLITGDSPAKQRAETVKKFQSGTLRLLIITVAGAEGIDLFAASHIIFVEREWTPAKEEQAEDRLHRHGQKSAVTCHYLIARNTVDERLADVVHQKRDLFGQVLSQDEIIQTVLDEV